MNREGKMKIAITGAKGFVGKNCIEYLKDVYEVVGLYREKDIGRFGEIPDIEYRGTSYSVESLKGALEGCDAIVHLAARKVISKEPNGLAEYSENFSTLQNILKAAQSLKINNIITISTRCVYGNYTTTSFKENDKLFPINFYGLEKVMEEQLCEYYNNMFNLNIKVLRLSQVISDDISDKNIFSVFIKQALNDEMISIYGQGSAIRDYIYIKDVCKGIKNALSHKEQKGIYNFASGTGVQLENLANLVIEKSHSKSTITHIESSNEDTSRIILNVEKMNKELDFSIEYSTERMIEDIMKDYINEKK